MEPENNNELRRSAKKKQAATENEENRVDVKKARKNKKTNPVWATIKRYWKKYSLTKISLILILVMVVATGSYLFYLAKTANVGILQESITAKTQILDKDGKVADELYGQKGTPVKFEQIDKDLQDAVIATEDRTFYSNHGVNLKRFVLAAVTLGRFGGGSTITQQLAKNAYLSQAQTVDRKAREFFLALEINKKYSKKEILTMYLNNSYFGNGVWGVQDASHKYFGVDASNLTVEQSAQLAAMLKGPEIFNPLYEKGKYAIPRKNQVLDNMVAAGYLKETDASRISKIDIMAELQDNYQGSMAGYKFPSYYNVILSEAEKKYGLTLQDIMNNGYKIYTGLDQNMQTGMQETYAETTLFPVAADGTSTQSGSVAVDPKTGQVRALVGNVAVPNYNPLLEFNYATQAKRSTGSTIKPLIAYAPAVEAGWSIDKVLKDQPTTYSGNWTPQNDDGTFRGTMPMYQALANSYNIPAINTYQEITPTVGNDMGRKFGLNLTEKNDTNLSTVLGAGVETNPWEMAQAYATFANDGVMNEAHVISKIEDATGKVIERAKVKSTRVISSDTAQKMTQMMLGTFYHGSAWNAAPASYTMAGKTGTNETTDQWVIGYTPDISIALWLGYPNANDQAHQLSGTSQDNPSVIFRQEASYILPWTKGTEFKEKNPYIEAGIEPYYAAWTAQRDLQDQVVAEQQAKAGTTGNTPAPAKTDSTSTTNEESGFDKFTKSVKDTTDNVVNSIKKMFGN